MSKLTKIKDFFWSNKQKIKLFKAHFKTKVTTELKCFAIRNFSLRTLFNFFFQKVVKIMILKNNIEMAIILALKVC